MVASSDAGPHRLTLKRIGHEAGFVTSLPLTPEAVAHGFHEAIPECLDLTVGYGRRAGLSADTTSPILLISVTNVPSRAHQDSQPRS